VAGHDPACMPERYVAMPQASRARIPPPGVTPGPPGPAELKFARWAWLTILLWQLATLLAAVGTVAVLRLVQGAVLVGVGVPRFWSWSSESGLPARQRLEGCGSGRGTPIWQA